MPVRFLVIVAVVELGAMALFLIEGNVVIVASLIDAYRYVAELLLP